MHAIPESAPRSRRGLKIVLALAIALFLIVVFLPALAGMFAPGLVRAQSGKAVAGTIDVNAVRLSWFGAQRLQGFSLRTPDGQSVVSGDLTLDRGLFGLVLGGKDLGRITLDGARAVIERYADGSTSLDRAVGTRHATTSSPSSSGSGEIALPAGFQASLQVSDLNATFIDKSKPGDATIEVRGVNARATIHAGQTASVEVAATTSLSQGGVRQEGTLKAKVRVDDWSTPAGRLTLDKASLDISIEAKGLPVELGDLFAGPVATGAEPLSVALGRSFDATIMAKGTMQEATLSVHASLPRASFDLDAAMKHGVLSVDKPAVLVLKGDALAGLVPALREAQQGVGAGRLDAAPDVTLRVGTLSLTLPAAGQAFDARSLESRIELETTGMRGTVRVGEGPEQVFAIEPLRVRIETPSLATGVKVLATTSLTLDAKDAGIVEITAQTGGLTDEGGNIRAGMPERFEGRVTIDGVATAIAQPFVELAGLDLIHDVGPTLDVSAAVYAASGGGAALPPTHIDLTIASEQIKASGTFRADAAEIATRDYGLKLEVKSAGRIASRLMGDGAGWRLTPAAGAGTLVLTLPELKVPRTKEGAPDLSRATGRLKATTSGLRLAKLDDAGRPAPTTIDLLGFECDANQQSDAVPGVGLRASLAYGSERFEAEATLSLPGVHEGAANMRPVGSVMVRNAPASLIGLFAAAEPGGRDLAALVREVAGPALTMTLTAEQPKPETYAAVLDLAGDGLHAAGRATLEKNQLALRDVALTTNLTIAGVRELLRGVAEEGVEVGGDGEVRLGVAPLTIPMEGWSPKFDRVGRADVTLSLPARTTLRNLALVSQDGPPRRVGEIGVEGFSLTSSLPLGAIMGSATEKGTAHLAATLLGENAAKAGTLALDAEIGLKAGAPDGPATLTLVLDDANTAMLDAFAGEGNLISGLLSDSAKVDVNVKATPGTSGFDANAAIDAGLMLASPRASTPTPLTLSVRPDRIALARPGEIRLEVNPALANRFLDAPSKADVPQPAAALRLSEAAPVTIALQSLVLPRGPGAMLEADVSLSAARLAMRSIERPQGKPATEKPLTLAGVSITAKTTGPADLRAIDYRVAVDRSELAGSPPATGLALTGHVDRLVGQDGALSTSGATITALGDIPVLPTGLIDALAHQDGMLVDVLGPAMSVKVAAERLPLSGLDAPPSPDGPATLNVAASSERASMSVRGEIRDQAFRASEPVRVQLFEVSPSVSARLLTGVPVAQFEKVKGEDAPGLIEAKDLIIPLDGDMTKLSGDIHVAPGEARFSTRSLFAEVLSIAKIRQAGQIGRRLQPLDVSMRRGVVEYSKWVIPLGEFKLETEGKVDLAKGEIDVVTSIPFGALTDEIAGSLNTGLGSAIGRNVPLLESLSMVPFRTKGPLGKPSTGADVKLLGERLIQKLNPIDAVRDGAGLIQDLLRPKPKPENPPAPLPANPPK